MLYKFKSKATGDLIMLEPNGRRMLEIVGKEPGPKGIILPQDMPAAIAALEAAVNQEEAEQAAMVKAAQTEGKPVPKFEPISLRQRAVPFIEMLNRCQKAEHEVVWGV
jgi:Domain of unknown function (DUF1840)